MGAVSVVFSALSTITNSVLQSIGQQKKPCITQPFPSEWTSSSWL